MTAKLPADLNSRAPHPPAIAVMGPTATGKTALAVALAQRHGGEIVSVDSALVYRGLDIGAAKPTQAQRGGIVHHMIDVCDPWHSFSAAEFATGARAVVQDILARGRLPVLVGGTGLYFRALLEGLSDMPAADPDVRAEITAQAARRGWDALHAELAKADPQAAARIHVTDAQRIQRALEVLRISGRPISDWQQAPPAVPPLPLRVLRLVLEPGGGRAVLHARIAQRFDAMLEAGFLDEVRALRALPQLTNHPSPMDLPALRAVGYRQAWQHLDRQLSAPDFRERAIFATRQLAKRQLTWLRREPDTQPFDPASEGVAINAAVTGFLSG